MRIRNDQLAKMTAVVHAVFASRMAAHLREVFPDLVQSLDEHALRDRCSLWINQALEAGFEDEADVELFVELCAYCPDIGNIPMAPWATAICGAAQTPAAKLSALLDQSVFAPEAG